MSEPEVLIHTGYLRHNLQALLKIAMPRKIFPVIKANAYGHGLTNVATFLENNFSSKDIPLFCVARLSEVAQLRSAGIKRRVLVMSHYGDIEASYPGVSMEQVDLAVHDFHDFETALAVLRGKKHLGWALHLNFNTGMNRLGFPHAELPKNLSRLMELVARAHKEHVPISGLMTHFARGEEDPEHFSNVQLARFHECVKLLKGEWKANVHGEFPCWIHAENSGALAHKVSKDSEFVTAARPGLHVWGSEAHSTAFKNLGLKTVMEVRAPVRQIFRVKSGEGIGYGSAYRCSRDTLVGTIPLGYADGVPRFFSRSESDPASRIGFMIEGIRAQILGKVSMDLTCVDLTDHPRAQEWTRAMESGERPELWAYWIGKGQSAKDIALEMKTIDYEIFCMVTARLNRREVQ